MNCKTPHSPRTLRSRSDLASTPSPAPEDSHRGPVLPTRTLGMDLEVPPWPADWGRKRRASVGARFSLYDSAFLKRCPHGRQRYLLDRRKRLRMPVAGAARLPLSVLRAPPSAKLASLSARVSPKMVLLRNLLMMPVASASALGDWLRLAPTRKSGRAASGRLLRVDGADHSACGPWRGFMLVSMDPSRALAVRAGLPRSAPPSDLCGRFASRVEPGASRRMMRTSGGPWMFRPSSVLLVLLRRLLRDGGMSLDLDWAPGRMAPALDGMVSLSLFFSFFLGRFFWHSDADGGEEAPLTRPRRSVPLVTATDPRPLHRSALPGTASPASPDGPAQAGAYDPAPEKVGVRQVPVYFLPSFPTLSTFCPSFNFRTYTKMSLVIHKLVESSEIVVPRALGSGGGRKSPEDSRHTS